jgi:hypothetical protein
LIATQDHRYIQEAILQSSLNPSRAPPSPRESIDDVKAVEKPSVPKHETIKTIDTIEQEAQPAANVARKKSIMKSIKSIFH